MSDDIVLSVAEVHALSVKVLLRAGLPESHAEAVANSITANERDQCASHGLYRLPGCVETIRSKGFNLKAAPSVERVLPAVIRARADFGYSLPAFEAALPDFVAAAKASGIAVLAINDCFHFSALWPEIEAIVEHDLAALAMTPSHAWVAPAGGCRPALGTNPFAFGWPRPGAHPYVFDFATSAIARGDLALHDIAGTPIPEGCGLTAEGEPTTNAAAALKGAMTTFGGHKGSAMSTMIELLAGPLIGDMTSAQSMAFDAGEKAAPCHGELLVAFDPVLLGRDRDGDTAAAEALFGDIVGQGARLPSQRRFAARERTMREGVRVPRVLWDRIEAIPF